MDISYINMSDYPYFYRSNRDDQFLFFLGVKHTFDPEDPQFGKIKEYWEQYLKKTKNGKRIVLIEGGIRPVEALNKTAIIKNGEMGFVTNQAFKNSIEIISPEPNFVLQIKQLESNFTKEEIIYYYFARIVLQWQRIIKKPDLGSYVDHFMKRYSQSLLWSNFDFSFANFVKLHDQSYEHKFNEKKCTCFYNDSNPEESLVANAVSSFRDTYLLDSILKEWNKGKNIFIAYGHGHMMKMKKVLKLKISKI